MSFKRGLTQTQTPSSTPAATPRIVGKTLTRQPEVIVTPQQQAAPSRIITRQEAGPQPQPVRGLLVDNSGRPLVGLSRATIEAHKAHTETASELCRNCGELRAPAQMKTIIPNAYNANNPLRICEICAKLAYKDPHKTDEKWTPSIPSVRFDRETAAPYDARARGVTIGELVTKDTYHNEREVDSKYRTDVLIGEGKWSGGGRAGHVATRESLERSRERAARVRR